MRAYDIIKKKRDGAELSEEEISFIVGGQVPDYQVSAFLMAVCLKGMGEAETVSLTKAMMHSGGRVDLSNVTGAKVDKHSTGGVGDKTSIILAPLIAAMGVKVPMVAGRGLGHTGGTIDKLESIPGMRTALTVEEFRKNIEDIGASIMCQSDDIAPADKRLYALRDVTSTVESVPLIASSIMSKKLSEGIQGLVLDVKCGSGAFMKSIEESRSLAQAMVGIGNSMGVKTVAVITDMDQPLGRTVGNSLEIKECISALRGKWAEDLMEVTLTLAAWMLNLADSISEETKLRKLNLGTMRRYQLESMDFIDKGDALKKFAEFIDAQYGDPETAFRPNLLPSAPLTRHVIAPREGFIRKLNAEAVGTASVLLGAGRKKAGDSVDPGAGIVLNAKVGDFVKSGQPLAIFHFSDEKVFKDAEDAFLSGVETGERETAKRPLIFETVLEA